MLSKKFEKTPMLDDEAHTAEYDFENFTPNH